MLAYLKQFEIQITLKIYVRLRGNSTGELLDPARAMFGKNTVPDGANMFFWLCIVVLEKLS